MWNLSLNMIRLHSFSHVNVNVIPNISPLQVSACFRLSNYETHILSPLLFILLSQVYLSLL